MFTSSKTVSDISAAATAAAKDAQSKSDTAQSNAEKMAAQRNEMAQKMGYKDYEDIVEKAKAGQTIIDGGYLLTALIEVEKLLAQSITMKTGGSLQSENYKAGKSGFKITSNGDAEFNDGIFNNISVMQNSFFHGDILSGPLELNSRNPSSETDVKIYKKGSSTKAFLDDVGGFSNKIVPCNGKLEDLGFSYY